MPIRYSAEVSGRAFKPVLCEHCDCTFVYQLHRRARVAGSTHMPLTLDEVKQAASDDATTLLDQSLKEDVDPVPCPRCGKYQENMVVELKRRRLRFVRWLAPALVFVGMLLWQARYPSWRGLFLRPPAALWGTGVLLLALRALDARRLDPNRDAAARAGKPAPGVEEIPKEQYREVMKSLDAGLTS
ncbi:MAG: hypothetical protein QM765_33820 [Myxococcales bacterium]